MDYRRGVRRRLGAALLCPPAGDHTAGRGFSYVDNGGAAHGGRPLRFGPWSLRRCLVFRQKSAAREVLTMSDYPFFQKI